MGFIARLPGQCHPFCHRETLDGVRPNVRRIFSRALMPSSPHSSRFHSTHTWYSPSSTIQKITNSSRKKNAARLRKISPEDAPQIDDLETLGNSEPAIRGVGHTDDDHVTPRHQLFLRDKGPIFRELVGIEDRGAVEA